MRRGARERSTRTNRTRSTRFLGSRLGGEAVDWNRNGWADSSPVSGRLLRGKNGSCNPYFAHSTTVGTGLLVGSMPAAAVIGEELLAVARPDNGVGIAGWLARSPESATHFVSLPNALVETDRVTHGRPSLVANLAAPPRSLELYYVDSEGRTRAAWSNWGIRPRIFSCSTTAAS